MAAGEEVIRDSVISVTERCDVTGNTLQQTTVARENGGGGCSGLHKGVDGDGSREGPER